MHRVLPAKFAEFLKFQFFFNILLVALGPISDPFALGAFEFYDIFSRHNDLNRESALIYHEHSRILEIN
jgi:hypothetical protein